MRLVIFHICLCPLKDQNKVLAALIVQQESSVHQVFHFLIFLFFCLPLLFGKDRAMNSAGHREERAGDDTGKGLKTD